MRVDSDEFVALLRAVMGLGPLPSEPPLRNTRRQRCGCGRMFRGIGDRCALCSGWSSTGKGGSH